MTDEVGRNYRASQIWQISSSDKAPNQALTHPLPLAVFGCHRLPRFAAAALVLVGASQRLNMSVARIVPGGTQLRPDRLGDLIDIRWLLFGCRCLFVSRRYGL